MDLPSFRSILPDECGEIRWAIKQIDMQLPQAREFEPAWARELQAARKDHVADLKRCSR